MSIAVRPRLVALTTLTALTLAGCSGPVGSSPPDAGSVEVPELGACRVLVPADIGKPVDDSDVVPCTKPHTAETFAVGELPADLRDAPYDDRRLGAFAYDRCSAAYRKFLGATESIALRTLLSWAWFRPTKEAWADGARWYRCDVVGGDEDSEQLIDLPRTAKGVMLPAPPDAFMACVDAADVVGAPRIPCDRPHQWRAVTTIKVGEPDEDYPGDRLVEVTTRDYCSTSVSAWLDYPPTYTFAYTWFHEAEWEAGNRLSVCWARTEG